MRVIADLKRHEGFRARPYRCSAGKLTIGYGLNLDGGITEKEATALLVMRVNDIEKQFADVPWYAKLSPARKSVIINMAYNLGIGGLFGFRLMLDAISSGDYQRAAAEMLDSKWARQVGNRARELAQAMETGQ